MSIGVGGSHESSSSNLDQLVKQFFSQSTNQSQTGTESGTSNVASSQTGTQAGTTAGESSGSNQRILSPEQQQANTSLGKVITALSTDPKSFYAPQQNAGREQVNENYAGLGDTLRQQFMTGGEGGSGKYGRAVLQGDLARRGDLSKVDNSFATQVAQAPLTAAQLAQNFLGINFGETSKGKTTGTTAGTTSSTGSTVGSTTGTNASTGVVNTTGTSEEQKKATQTGSSNKVAGSVGL